MKRRTKEEIARHIDMARGLKECPLVLRNAKWLDVFSGKWLKGDIAIADGVIVGVGEKYKGKVNVSLKSRYLVPGFIDSHVHVESTLMTPSEFERTVLPRGTTSAILDPHEIVNVMGKKGLEYILRCSEKSKMDLFVMLSSCVPATHLETSGAKLLAADLLPYRKHPQVLGLAEMMNYPGLLNKDSEVIDKIYEFQDGHMDGHAPMLRGKDLNAYLGCGIKTCHESVSLEEAHTKIERGMQVMLREGSVAKNLKELVGVLNEYSSPFVSLCTDDRNPLDILDEGHVDYLIRLALRKGITPAVVYRSASLSTALCFGLEKKGALAPGYDADIVVLKDYRKCIVDRVFKRGELVTSKNSGQFEVPLPNENTIQCVIPTVDQLQVLSSVSDDLVTPCRVIGIIPDSIITNNLSLNLKTKSGYLQPNLSKDILKIAVLERYGHGSAPSVAFVHGMGLKKGAVGSSVGHDSHNAVVIGTNDEDMIQCFSRIKELGGGFVVVHQGKVIAELPLPIAGLMTHAPLKEIYARLKNLRKVTRQMGCPLSDPFLQMAFLCLPVIPQLKITDRGLVDVDQFSIVSVNLKESSIKASLGPIEPHH